MHNDPGGGGAGKGDSVNARVFDELSFLSLYAWISLASSRPLAGMQERDLFP